MENSESKGLERHLGLLSLTATGICAMVGASVYVVPIMIQKNVPGIGPWVLPAFLLASLPALLAALSYASMAAVFPGAGGSYIYASRGLHPFLGFVASFSQWFGLSLVIGVIAFIIPPFFRDFFDAVGWSQAAGMLEKPLLRLGLALGILGTFTLANVRGSLAYRGTLLPLMFLMFALGGLVIGVGWSHDHADFALAQEQLTGRLPVLEPHVPFSWQTLLTGASILFSSFIGFDAIAQAGGEAKNPQANLPRAILLTIAIAGLFYFLFTGAVYHTVPWWYIAEESLQRDLTAPGLLACLVDPIWSAVMLLGASIALLNDLPAMILSVSRLIYSWSADGVAPTFLSRVHPATRMPVPAILTSASVSAVGLVGCHVAGDFFLGIDIMVTAMLVNFMLVSLSVLFLPRRYPALAAGFPGAKYPWVRNTAALVGFLLLLLLFIFHTMKDLSEPDNPWYFRATWLWLIVMVSGCILYFFFRRIRKSPTI